MVRLFGFDWRNSPAYNLLLTNFLHPQNPDIFAQGDEWRQVLREDPLKAIKRFVDEGLLVPVTLSELLARKCKVSHLKEMLQQCGLPTSGRKEELIARLVEANPEGARRQVVGLTLLKCSEAGRQTAEAYLAQERIKREQMEKKVIQALKDHRFRDASLAVASYEAEQVFPRGMGIDWRHYDPTNDVELLAAIFQRKPKRLAHLTDVQMEAVRIAAGMCALGWNLGQATEWLEANIPAGLDVSCNVAIHVTQSYAWFTVEIGRLQQLGCKWVEVRTCNDGFVCDACKKLADKKYAIDKVPELPYENCSSEVCRCWIAGSWR